MDKYSVCLIFGNGSSFDLFCSDDEQKAREFYNEYLKKDGSQENSDNDSTEIELVKLTFDSNDDKYPDLEILEYKLLYVEENIKKYSDGFRIDYGCTKKWSGSKKEYEYDIYFGGNFEKTYSEKEYQEYFN